MKFYPLVEFNEDNHRYLIKLMLAIQFLFYQLIPESKCNESRCIDATGQS